MSLTARCFLNTPTTTHILSSTSSSSSSRLLLPLKSLPFSSNSLLRFPLITKFPSPLLSRVFSSLLTSSTAPMGDAPDAGMDAVQRRLMFEDEKLLPKMGRPHVLVLPYPAQGHVSPMMHLAQSMARQGIKITFVNSDFNHKRVNGNKADSNISLVSIPDGMEPEDDRNNHDQLWDCISSTMPGKLEELIQVINSTLDNDSKITGVVYDGTLACCREVVEKMETKMAVFWPTSAAYVALGLYLYKLVHDQFVVPDEFSAQRQMIQLSPDSPAFDTKKIPWYFIGDRSSQKSTFKYLAKTSRESYLAEWNLSNSTYELEPGAFSMVPKLLPIGPLIANYDTSNSGGQFWQEDSTCMEWLDQQPPQSVLYVAFGSTSIFNQKQFQELALGLELTERPYLWVVRPGITNQSKFYPEEFVGSRGKIVEWVPQQQVLRHPAIACFVSHCGWNSTIEGVSNGVPFLCWPYFADQFFNMDYICNLWKVGLGFGKDENGIIKKEEFKGKVEQLLGDDNIRSKSLDLKQKLTNSIAEGGQSSKNFSDFITWLKS